MRARISVPANLPMEVSDPNTWPRIVVVGDMLDVPGIGPVRKLDNAYVLGWRYRTSCPIGCFAEFEPDYGSCVRGRRPWESPSVTLRGCIDAVDLAIAVRSSIGAVTPTLYVATGVNNAIRTVLAIYGADWSDCDPSDEAYVLCARCGYLELNNHYDPITSVHWLRRNLQLPSDWQR